MSKLLTHQLGTYYQSFRTQEFVKDPVVYAIFFFPASSWTWFVTEGQQEAKRFHFSSDTLSAFESEWGYFTLSELEELDIHGLKIERVQDFIPTPISELKKQAAGM
ncbi:MAG: DUF2958 domain-containing protein [Candidatus Omnitrophica bacterium]|nr:DUF2958 domain-containing protein [Candidatus Omnitrophota bacterium]